MRAHVRTKNLIPRECIEPCLEGIKVKRCIIVDEERGYVVVNDVDENGCLIIKNSWPVTRKIKGNVEVIIDGRLRKHLGNKRRKIARQKKKASQ